MTLKPFTTHDWNMGLLASLANSNDGRPEYTERGDWTGKLPRRDGDQIGQSGSTEGSSLKVNDTCSDTMSEIDSVRQMGFSEIKLNEGGIKNICNIELQNYLHCKINGTSVSSKLIGNKNLNTETKNRIFDNNIILTIISSFEN